MTESGQEQSASTPADRVGDGMPTALGQQTYTERLFPLVKFRDRYGVECSLQASSLAEFEQPGTSAVWLGPDDASPQIMASQAARLGVATRETSGWISYPIPEDVQMTTRMHLDREQVTALIHHLARWLETGQFEGDGAPDT